MHTIIHGDCLEELKKLDDSSVDAVITDPPYGLSNTKPAQVADVLAAWVTGDTEKVPAKRGGFMGADWDSFVPPPAVWQECMRVLKPGGHMAVFAGARTQDLMGLSIRLAGFEIRDTLGWIYGSGFPKSHDIGKAIDKRPGVVHHKEFGEMLRTAMSEKGYTNTFDVAEKVTGRRTGAVANWIKYQFPEYKWWPALRDLLDLDEEKWGPIIAEASREKVGERRSGDPVSWYSQGERGEGIVEVTLPSTSYAKRWDGWGTALKPAIEPIILARKPLDGTVANNVLAHGVGGLNIDACRVGNESRINLPAGNKANSGGVYKFSNAEVDAFNGAKPAEVVGRFPANVLLDEHAAKEMDKQSGHMPSSKRVIADKLEGGNKFPGIYGEGMAVKAGPIGYEDSGGASRFFPVFKYQAKAPKKERPVIEREDGTKIQHPTVKPLALMEWLVTLITPEGGTVLDPFAGSGTTLQAATNKGFNPIGIEADADYIQLINTRLEGGEQSTRNN